MELVLYFVVDKIMILFRRVWFPARPWRFRAACAGALLLFSAVTAFGLPAGLGLDGQGLREVGRGELRWLGFKLYDATLWAGQPGEAAVEDIHALSIRYARAVSAERLVSVSLDEMRRLGAADEATLASWEKSLAEALPSVAAGDTLTGIHQPGQGARFWHDERFVGEIDDPALARAFFSIWLDPRTREPGLRARLLGLDPAQQ